MADAAPELELPTGERLSIRGPLVLGRSNEADLVIADPEASRRHAQIRPQNGGYLLIDLESRNGTMVNGQPVIEPRPLRDGDEITIGRTSLVFHSAPPGAPQDVAVPVTMVVQATAQMPSARSSPMQVFGRISRQLAGLLDAKALADAVTKAIKDEYGCEGASVILVDDDAGELYFASVASSEAANLKLMTLRRGQGIAGRVIESGSAALVTDVVGDPDHASELDRALGFSSRSIVAAPISAPGGEVLGALEAVNPLGKPAFDGDDLEFVTLVASQLGVALANAKSWEAVEREREALSRVAGTRREFVATSPESIRLLVEVAGLHAARTPTYLAGERGTGKRTLARLTHEASGESSGLVELDGNAGLLPANLDEVLVDSPVHVTHLDGLPLPEQERLAVAIPPPAARRPLFVSGGASLLSLIAAGKLAPALHAVLESGQRVVPPLRMRADDFDPLVEHFTGEVTNRLKRDRFTFAPDALALLHEYAWPGNVAELGGVIRRVGILSRDAVVGLADLLELAPELMRKGEAAAGTVPPGAIERKAAARIALAREQLSGPDGASRHEAVASLAALPGGEATGALREFLDAPEAAVRARAAEAQGSRDGATEALAARLEVEADGGVAVVLLEALAAAGDPAASDVVERALAAGDGRVRRSAMRTLRRLGGEDARRVAAQAVADTDTGLAAEATATLAGLGDGTAGERLVGLIGHASQETAAVAIELCGELGIGGDELARTAATGEPLLRVAAVRALGAAGDPRQAGTLVGLLGDPALRGEAVQALGLLRSPEAAPAVRAIAEDASAPLVVRRSALRSVAQVGGPGAFDALRAALAEPDLAETAIEGLAVLGDPAAEPALIDLLSSNPERASSIARALAGAGAAASVAPLLRAAALSPQQELPALEALVAICRRARDREAVIAAFAAACEDEALRLGALQVLGEAGEPRAVPLFLAYRDWSQEARTGLRRLGPEAAPGLLGALDGEQHEAAEDALAEMGADVIPQVLPLLGSPTLGRTAARVIEAAGELALPALLDAADRRDGAMLPLTLQLIGRAGTGRTAPYVATFLDSPVAEVRYAAIVALGDLPDPSGEAALLDLMRSDDTITAGLATLALGRAQSARAFELVLSRAVEQDRTLQYASAGAIANYNLSQPPVLALIHRTVRGGWPFTSKALEAALRTGALETGDILETLLDGSVGQGQKLRIISALGKLEGELAVPALVGLVGAPGTAMFHGPLVGALVRHESMLPGQVAAMVRDPAAREAGIAVLTAMQEPRPLLEVLRELSPAIDTDAELRAALRAKGDQLLGPLLDVLFDHWDLETLALLWQLSQVATNDGPNEV